MSVAAYIAFAALLGLSACDDGAPVTIAGATRGRQVFADPGFSASRFNVFSCATCHATTSDAPPGVAVSLADVTRREAWWGGKVRTLLDASDFCWVYFMRGFPSIDGESDDARALFDYLASLSTGAGTDPLPTLPLTAVETIVEPAPGDATHGSTVYDRACRVCHGDPHTGAGRIGPAVVVIPEASQDLAEELGVDIRLVLTEKVRHGQFFGVGGNMPFYPLEQLSESELADLLEYLSP